MESNRAGVKAESVVEAALRGLVVSDACRALARTKWKWMKDVLRSDLPMSARVVGIYLCDRIDESGVTFPDQEEIAAHLHMTPRAVRAALKVLHDRRFLAVVRARWAQARNVYGLADPKVAGMVEDAIRVVRHAKAGDGGSASNEASERRFNAEENDRFKPEDERRFHRDVPKETYQRDRGTSDQSPLPPWSYSPEGMHTETYSSARESADVIDINSRRSHAGSKGEWWEEWFDASGDPISPH